MQVEELEERKAKLDEAATLLKRAKALRNAEPELSIREVRLPEAADKHLKVLDYSDQTIVVRAAVRLGFLKQAELYEADAQRLIDELATPPRQDEPNGVTLSGLVSPETVLSI